MSKLQELINELCPDGVEYTNLDDVLDYEQPSKYIVNSTEYNDTFSVPVLTAGQTFILGYTNETQGIFISSKDVPVIIFDDFTTSFHWVDFNFKVKSSAMKILKPKEDRHINFRYIYHSMKNIKYNPVDHSRQWIGKYSKFKIPLPPLEVQQEIVRILDTFTELTTELTAELDARKKQYEYYKNILLTFNNDIKTLRLEEVAEVIDSLHKTPTYSASGYNMIRVTDIKGGLIDYCNTLKVDYDTYSEFTKKYKPQKGDLVMSRVGSYGNVSIIPQDNLFCMGQNTVVIHPLINNKYLYYILTSNYVKSFIEKNVFGGSQKTLSLKNLKDIPIPLPSLQEQERIVSILDRFDSLCNDITKGIPAEIEARRKQYEYYRDKLLTFKELKKEGV